MNFTDQKTMSCSFYHPTQVMLSDLRYYLSSSYSYSTRIKMQIVLHCDNSYFWPYSPSPVTEYAKIFKFRENFCFMFLHRPIIPEKFLCKPQNGQLAPKLPIFTNDGKSPFCSFSNVGSKFKCLQLIYRWKGNL